MSNEEQAQVFDTETRVRIPGERRRVANAITTIGQAVAKALDVPFDPPPLADLMLLDDTEFKALSERPFDGLDAALHGGTTVHAPTTGTV